ncbi:MAG TPA: cupredoxin domain-containing protein [Bacteroidota bacterium]|nr:cupredoxin domain-containing protein [Bacteroidota bacterium]
MKTSLIPARCFAALVVLTLIVGCGTTKQFEPLPASLDRNAVRTVTVEMSARSYEYSPDTVRVPAQTLLKLRITATDGTHGFALGAFGIDERLEKGVAKEIELYAAEKGEYPFHCSHFCGMGHFGMDGLLIVE